MRMHLFGWLFLYLGICVCVHVCAHTCTHVHRGQKRMPRPLGDPVCAVCSAEAQMQVHMWPCLAIYLGAGV